MNSDAQPHRPTRSEKRAVRRSARRDALTPDTPPLSGLSPHLEKELGEILSHSTHPELVPLRLKLSARLFSGTLDNHLASGLPPESDPLLAERALTIASPTWRANLARTWAALLPQAANPPSRSRFDCRVPLNSREILSCSREIEYMIERLVAPLVAIRGVALASTVLTDGAGPVYYERSSRDLSSLLSEIVTYLNPAHHA